MQRLLQKGVLLIVLSASGASAQFHPYTTKDGLPSNHIVALCQDSRGFLWIGTDEGLAVYDGETFRTFSTVDGLLNNYINFIVESTRSPGVMWIASIADGIARYDRGAFRAFPLNPPGTKTFIGNLLEDRTGTLWCLTTSGVYTLVGDSLLPRHVYPPQYFDGGDMVAAADGKIWVGVNRAIYICTPGESGPELLDPRLPPRAFITHMSVDRDGDVWVSASDGTLARFVGRSKVASGRDTAHGLVAQVLVDNGGDLWMTTSAGVVRAAKLGFPGSRVTSYGASSGLPSSPFDPLLEDREGNAWFGSRVAGLFKMSDKNAVKMPMRNSESGFVDDAGHLWLGSERGAWECWKGADGEWRTEDHPLGGAAGDRVRILRRDGRGRLWRQMSDDRIVCDTILHAASGPSRLRTVLTLRPGADFPKELVWTFYVDPVDVVWVSIGSGVAAVDLRKTSGSPLTLFRTAGDLNVSSVRAILRDAEGNVWLGGFSDGLAMLEGPDAARRPARRFTTADGLPDNAIRSLAEDRRGNVWIGTRFGGVAVHDGAHIRSVSMKEGLPSNAVWYLAPDAAGRMWLGTGVGAVSLDIADPRILRKPPLAIRDVCAVYYSAADSMTWLVDPNEAIALGREEGARAAPKVTVTRVTANDRIFDLAAGNELPYDRNNIVVEYVAPSFIDERPVRYRYRVLGIDTAWSAPTRQRSVTYAALAPGEYTFEVTAVSPGGNENLFPASFLLRIAPPLWRRWWFLTAAAVFAAGSVVSLVRRKIAALEERRKMQDEFARRLIDSQESERGRIAAELHDTLGQSLLVIQNNALLALDAKGGIPEIEDRLKNISGTTTQTIEEVRRVAHNLRPYHLDKLGLTTSIEAVIRRVAEASGISFATEIDHIDNLVSRECEIHIYRIVQEALNNIVKHSHAASASVAIRREAGTVRITIRDDGRGFDRERAALPAPDETPHGFGLVGLAERVRILQGRISFGSTPGRGTTVIVELPVAEDGHA